MVHRGGELWVVGIIVVIHVVWGGGGMKSIMIPPPGVVVVIVVAIEHPHIILCGILQGIMDGRRVRRCGGGCGVSNEATNWKGIILAMTR